uniref:Coiled-coil domain-containing protein 27 n=1 Tax=Pyxicephalus adspersus TaxID=30357 RepID=A0AAV2ZR12_PYXAD|nr:TPA: hypothetical protein GDO54_003809 [Pyxicephalus adspersus]
MQSFNDLPWTGVRRPKTAVWRISKMDARREKYSKSARDPICAHEIQSPGLSSSVAFSFESNVSSQLIDLQTKLPHIYSSTDHTRSNIWDGSSLSLHHSGSQSPQAYLTSVEIKTPWYITVLNEKERCLLKLGEEINRLSRYEVESKRKDQIISTLKNEISQLQCDLQQTSRPHTGREEEGSSGRDVTQEVLDLSSSPRGLLTSSERNVSTISLAGSYSEIHRDSPQIEAELDGENTAQEPNMDFIAKPEDQKDSARSVDESEEKSSMLQKLQEEIEAIKKDYELSKGVISSLQRIISSNKSMLRKLESEKEGLQRELVERGVQLQAMSNKFSSMREERKHEEMMAAMEKENYNLRELASELKSEVSRRNDLIGDLKSDIQRLQKEILECQTQMKRNEGERSQIESKAGDLATSEQHVRVTLEALQSRYERFRSKIIQAAYTAPGFKGPQVEVSDNEILEAMQRIITDRSDFHQQLKQKGVKVPPLHLSETSAAVKHSSSTLRKKAQ